MTVSFSFCSGWAIASRACTALGVLGIVLTGVIVLWPNTTAMKSTQLRTASSPNTEDATLFSAEPSSAHEQSSEQQQQPEELWRPQFVLPNSERIASACRKLPGTIRDAASTIRRWSLQNCQSKSTAHRYHMQYARALLPHRLDATSSTIIVSSSSSSSNHSRPLVNILQVGLHCDTSCPATTSKLFQQFMGGPAVTSYAFVEPNIKRCKEKYQRGKISRQLERNIDERLCALRGAVLASSSRVADDCGRRFGPFNLVVEGRSLSHAETTASMRFWLNRSTTKSGLLPGGVLLVEGLHFSTLRSLHSTAGVPLPSPQSHPTVLGATPTSYALRLLCCKLVGMFCAHDPPAGPQHSIQSFVHNVAEVVLGPESVAIRTALEEVSPKKNKASTIEGTQPMSTNGGAAAGATPPPCTIVDDVSFALGSASLLFPETARLQQKQQHDHHPSATSATNVNSPPVAVLSKPARIFVVYADKWYPHIESSKARGEEESNDSNLHHHLLAHECPIARGGTGINTTQQQHHHSSATHSYFVERFGVHGYSVVEGCLSRRCNAKCILDSLLSSFDLIWVVVPENTQDKSTFDLQRQIVEILTSWKVATSTILKVGGVVALDGFQSRQRRASSSSLETSSSSSPPIISDVREPLLQFLLDTSMRLVSSGPKKWWGGGSFSSSSSSQTSRTASSSPPSGKRHHFPWVLSKPAYQNALVALHYVGDISIGTRGTLFLRKMDAANRRVMNLGD